MRDQIRGLQPMLRNLFRLLLSAFLPTDSFRFCSAELDEHMTLNIASSLEMTGPIGSHAGFAVVSIAPAR